MRSGLLGKMQEQQMDPTQQAKPSYVLITDSPLHNGNKEGHAQKNQITGRSITFLVNK